MVLIIMELVGNVSLKPEKSKTNELYINYNILENLSFNSTAYRS